MNPIQFAMRRPITVIVVVAAVALGGALAARRMPIDVFPNLNLPVIYVAQPYGGMDPAQMEGLIANYYEYHFLYIGGIHHVESKNIQGVALMKLVFHPGVDMAQAMAETIGYVNRARAFMPPGTVPPFVTRFDVGSVPVGYLVLSSATRSIGEIQDQALFKVRPMFASLPGVSAPPPFGGNQRTIAIRLDPERIRALKMSPDEVVRALGEGNAVSPSGIARIDDLMPIVPVNALARSIRELEQVPIRLGTAERAPVTVRDVAQVVDTTDIPTGSALVDGRRAVYLLVTKRADASTLAVVDAVKAALPAMQAVLPDDIVVRFEFDQSPTVRGAVAGLAYEAMLGASLTGLMVLLFLRDWRSVIVVVLNIPLAIAGAVCALWMSGQTINLMTLSGLALAVGVLVDEATVEMENIHHRLDASPSAALAVRRGNIDTAAPRLLAMLCVIAVFIPTFFMRGAARALFAPISLAVGFAMIASYLLSSTFVPVMSTWLLKQRASPHQRNGASPRPRRRSLFDRARSAYGHAATFSVALRWIAAPVAIGGAACVVVLVGRGLGLEIFPRVDAGRFQLRMKAPAGTRIEKTELLALEALDEIAAAAGRDNIDVTIGYIGNIPSSYPINAIYQWTAGPEEAMLRVGLKPTAGIGVGALERDLRARLARRLPSVGFSFEPADIVSEVMSFGSPTPIEIAVIGPTLADDRAYALKLRDELAVAGTLRDVRFGQVLDYPTVRVDVDRLRAGRMGVQAGEVARAVVAATSSSRFVAPNFWPDPKTGIGYQVQVEIPYALTTSLEHLGNVPIREAAGRSLLVRDVATVTAGTMPGEIDRYNMKRMVSLTANLAGRDLGRASSEIDAALKRAGAPPRGVTVESRGQIAPLHEIVNGLAAGLLAAVVVIILLLTAFYQSLRLAMVVVSTIPIVLAGVVGTLAATGTTLNLQSFNGAIMSVGVAMANAILLVEFAERGRVAGLDAGRAAITAATERLRPILMTSAAMIAGMMPPALGMFEGGEQAAPLGRAVVGGLIAATASTLFILPAVFTIVMRRTSTRSSSLDPFDPASPHYRPPGAREDSRPDAAGAIDFEADPAMIATPTHTELDASSRDAASHS